MNVLYACVWGACEEEGVVLVQKRSKPRREPSILGRTFCMQVSHREPARRRKRNMQAKKDEITDKLAGSGDRGLKMCCGSVVG
jgi:hypothetical protein